MHFFPASLYRVGMRNVLHRKWNNGPKGLEGPMGRTGQYDLIMLSCIMLLPKNFCHYSAVYSAEGVSVI